MKHLFKKIIYSIGFISKMPDDMHDLKFVRKCINKGLSEDYMLPLLDFDQFPDINMDKEKKNILVVTHDFSRTGAPQVALDVCSSLKEIYNADIYVLGPNEGALKEEFNKLGHKVLSYNELPKKKSLFANFCNDFDLIFVNSFSDKFFYILNLCKEKLKTPVIWYTHEIYNSATEFLPKRAGQICSLILYVSPLIQKSITNIDKNIKAYCLTYGLNEVSFREDNINPEVTTFLCVGTIEERKNQKAFVKAIMELPENLRQQSKFYIIGSSMGEKGGSIYEKELKQMAKNTDRIEFIPNIPQKELFEYYNKSDCIVCTSIQDPMPIVVTHGFMARKIPIISKEIGQALLCEDKKNALIFDVNNSDELCNIMSEVIQNKDKYKQIGLNSREVYEKYFSMQNFKKHLKEYLDKYLL